jgi:mercuric ion transport protein
LALKKKRTTFRSVTVLGIVEEVFLKKSIRPDVRPWESKSRERSKLVAVPARSRILRERVVSAMSDESWKLLSPNSLASNNRIGKYRKKKAMAFLHQHLDKVGVGGSVFAALCCLGLSALLSILSAVGLGLLINDAILLPLLVVSLAFTLYGLYQRYQKHRWSEAVLLGGASTLALLIFLLVFFNRPLAYLSIAGLVAASVLNVRLRMQRA